MRRRRPTPCWAVDAIEPMVLVTFAQAGPRASAMLSGLLSPLGETAGTLLATLRCQTAPELHARWMRAFRPAVRHAPPTADVPGRLGALVCARLTGRGPVLADWERSAPPWVGWSRRLALERREAGPHPPRYSRVPSSGRAHRQFRG